MAGQVDLLKAYNDAKAAVEKAEADKEAAFQAYLNSIPEEIREALQGKTKKKDGPGKGKGSRTPLSEDQKDQLSTLVVANLKKKKTWKELKKILDGSEIEFTYKTSQLNAIRSQLEKDEKIKKVEGTDKANAEWIINKP